MKKHSLYPNPRHPKSAINALPPFLHRLMYPPQPFSLLIHVFLFSLYFCPLTFASSSLRAHTHTCTNQYFEKKKKKENPLSTPTIHPPRSAKHNTNKHKLTSTASKNPHSYRRRPSSPPTDASWPRPRPQHQHLPGPPPVAGLRCLQAPSLSFLT